MRIFGDPTDGTLDEDDFVFVGLLPIPFDLAFVGVVAGPYSVQAGGVFIPGAVIGEGFTPGAVAMDTHIPGAVEAEAN